MIKESKVHIQEYEAEVGEEFVEYIMASVIDCTRLVEKQHLNQTKYWH